MAQQTVRLKRSSVQGRVPSTQNVELGEIAINTFDGRAFFKRDNGSESIVEFTTNITINQSPQGGTGFSSYGIGDLLVGSSSGSLEKSSDSTGAIVIPVGTTAQRPSSPVAGMMRFNSETSQFEGYNGSEWGQLGSTETIFNFEGDLNTLSGGEDLQLGDGVVDLMGDVTPIEGDLATSSGTEDLNTSSGVVDLDS